MVKVLGHRGCTSMLQRKEKQGDNKKENRKDKLHERRTSAKRAHIRIQRLHKHDAKKRRKSPWSTFLAHLDSQSGPQKEDFPDVHPAKREELLVCLHIFFWRVCRPRCGRSTVLGHYLVHNIHHARRILGIVHIAAFLVIFVVEILRILVSPSCAMVVAVLANVAAVIPDSSELSSSMIGTVIMTSGFRDEWGSR